MSIQAVDYVLDRSPSRGLRRLVLISIANHANRHGASCYPSIEMIADEAGVGRATAWRAIETLEADGEILVKRARGRGNRSEYVLVMGRNPEACGVLFDDPEAMVDGEEPRRRGRPRKVPQRNVSDPPREGQKVSQRNKKVPTMMELFGEDVKVPKGDDKSSIAEQKSSIFSRARCSFPRTVIEPSLESSSSSEQVSKNETDDDDDFDKTYRTVLGGDWNVATGMFRELFPDLVPKRVEAMLGDVERDVGPVSKGQLQAGLDAAYESLKRANGSITHVRPYVTKVITERLREVSRGSNA